MDTGSREENASKRESGAQFGFNRTEIGVARGWFFDRTTRAFLSDRQGETYSPAALRALAAVGSEQTYMLVPRGSGLRMAIDGDLDGHFDGDLLVQSLTGTSNVLAVSWTSVVGLTYQLQYKNDPSDPAWNTLPGGVAGTGNTVSMSDNSLGTNRARYYRVTTIEP